MIGFIYLAFSFVIFFFKNDDWSKSYFNEGLSTIIIIFFYSFLRGLIHLWKEHLYK